ncbi:hypothetical protein [Pseudonocardia sp. HH130630-07]|uniref:hypothetical protein n=1 Tax=Pseudonocardia sp. HH130630-07 TaxID=1690815 RepID=UPI0012E99BBB|nr:hypothetical protein [Pseudonocardia sp. HH130630-07]
MLTPTAPAPSVPEGALTDGIYEVGVDIEAGTYRTDGPDRSTLLPNCYYERARDASGTLDAVIANKNMNGPGIVTVEDGEIVRFSGACAWMKS